MGYTTEFEGKISIDKPLDDGTYDLLVGLSNTRRMKRNIEGYGIEGEFYIKGSGFIGQDRDSTVIDYNSPPTTQPSLWLQWIPTEDRQFIEWNEAEKFYYSEEWMRYIIDKILAPNGYLCNGEITAQGEEMDDRWKLVVENNVVRRENLR